MSQSGFDHAYTSMSGTDIKAVWGTQVLATLQGISWSVTRERVPIYTMGSPNPRGYSRNKRAIAGSLIFFVFDRHNMLWFAGQNGSVFQSDKDSLRVDNSWTSALNAESVQGAANPPLTSRTKVNPGSVVFDQESFVDANDPFADQEVTDVWYPDQILPFDVTLTAMNEYGYGATMTIYGIELLNEGSGSSVDDPVLEQQFTFVARDISHWRPLGRNKAMKDA